MRDMKSKAERISTKRFIATWLLAGLALRLVLMLVIHFTQIDKSLQLTKDGFLYDRVGVEMSEYLRTGNSMMWPARVTRVVDFGWEYYIGGVYYLFGHQPLLIKLSVVLAGVFVPLIHYRIALLATDDERVARLVLVLSMLFPTQVYYSTLMVRDAIATLGVSLIFLGITEYITRPLSRWLLHLVIGFTIMVLLRSYLAAILAITIPIGFLLAGLLGSGNSGRGRILVGGVLIAVFAFGVVSFSPGLIAEVDTQFADINYVNKVRRKLNQGSGAFYRSGNVTEVGTSVTESITSFVVGIYFFFFSINPSSLTSLRQIIAVPEVILVAVGALYSIRGGCVLWRERRYRFIVLMFPTAILTLGYSIATTNGGPLMRWRMQLVGIYLVLAATGLLAARVQRGRKRTVQPRPARVSAGSA